MREKKLHVVMKHGRSFLTGEDVVFYEYSERATSSAVFGELSTERNSIVRRMLGWPKSSPTIYPSTEGNARPEGDTARAT